LSNYYEIAQRLTREREREKERKEKYLKINPSTTSFVFSFHCYDGRCFFFLNFARICFIPI